MPHRSDLETLLFGNLASTRGAYWAGVVAIFAATFLCYVPIAAVGGLDACRTPGRRLVTALILLAPSILLMRLVAQRLNDTGRARWPALLFLFALSIEPSETIGGVRHYCELSSISPLLDLFKIGNPWQWLDPVLSVSFEGFGFKVNSMKVSFEGLSLIAVLGLGLWPGKASPAEQDAAQTLPQT